MRIKKQISRFTDDEHDTADPDPFAIIIRTWRSIKIHWFLKLAQSRFDLLLTVVSGDRI